jgi:hypothetical protein
MKTLEIAGIFPHFFRQTSSCHVTIDAGLLALFFPAGLFVSRLDYQKNSKSNQNQTSFLEDLHQFLLQLIPFYSLRF